MTRALPNAADEIFERPPWAKVFVSSKMAGGALRSERERAVEIIERFPHLRAWAWERDAAAGPYYSEAECLGHARTCDALVLILEDELTATTRKEYAAARRRRAHCILLLRQGCRRSDAVRRFIARAWRDSVTANFGTPSEFETQLFAALRAFSVRPAREVMLSRRSEQGERNGLPSEEARSYVAMDLLVGEPDGTSSQAVADIVEDARRAVREGRPAEAVEALWDLAESALDAGLPTVASDLLDDLREIVPSSAIDRRWQAWVLNCEGRILSRREESDEARARFSRMRQIGRLIGDSDIESTALQNLGVVAVINDDWDDASAVFQAALELKTENGDAYGAVQTVLNQVNVLMGLGQLEAAERWLDEAADVVRSERAFAHLQASIEGQRALLRVEEGRFDDARPLMLRSLRAARRTSSTLRELMALRNLAKLDEDRGAYRESLRWYEKGIALARLLDDQEQEEVLRRGNALALHSSGQDESAGEEFCRAATLAGLQRDVASEAQYLADATACFMRAKSYGRAKQAVDRLLASPEEMADSRVALYVAMRAEVDYAQGDFQAAVDGFVGAANLTDEWGQSAAYLRRAALAALSSVPLAERAPELLDRELELRRAHQSTQDWAWESAVMGSILTPTAQVEHSLRFFGAAVRVFSRRRDNQRTFEVRNDRAIALATLGRFSSAIRDLRRSLDAAEQADDRALAAQAHLNLSEVLRRNGDYSAAREHAEAGRVLAHELEEPSTEAQALVSLGLCLADQEMEEDEVVALFTDARSLASASRDETEVALVDKHIAHIDYGRGRFGKAAARYRSAARRLGDSSSRQLVEAAAGLVLSEAARGRYCDGETQGLIDEIERTGWYEPGRDTLLEASRLLLDKTQTAAAGEMAAIGVLCGAMCADTGDGAAELLHPLARLLDQAERLRVQTVFRRALRKEIHRHPDGGECHQLVGLADEVRRRAEALLDGS